MKFNKITLNNWYKDSVYCSSESLEFDERMQFWKNPVVISSVYSRRIKYNETNSI